MREHGTLHIPDVRAQNDFPMVGTAGTWRTFLAVPLRQQGELIGALIARRIEVRPFTPAQIKLLETFADQAVIAIENVRLFNGTQRNRWSSRLRRVKSWASSPARRRISSRCLTSWPKMLRGYVMQPMPDLSRRGQRLSARGLARNWLLLTATSLGPSSAVYLQAGLLLTARSYTLLMF